MNSNTCLLLIDMDKLQVNLPTEGSVRAQVRLGDPLQFQAGSGDFILDHDEE